MNIDKGKLKIQLTTEEGYKNKPYFDTEKKLTIGIGRNLTDVGLSNDEVDYLFNNDVGAVLLDLQLHWPWINNLDEVRTRVLADMCFNMGFETLSEFKLMIMAIKTQNYPLAAHEMLQSKWASQVGSRATKLSQMMETGNDIQ